MIDISIPFKPLSAYQVMNKLSFTISIFIACIFLFFGFIGWPGLHWDASFFAPVAINLATGKGWTFQGHLFFSFFRGNNVYDFHGFFQPLIYGGLLKASTMQALLLWMALINIATFAAYSFLFGQILKRNQSFNKYYPIFLAIVPGLIALGLQGRPEQFLPLLFSIPLILKETNSSFDKFYFSLPIISALACITSPLPGIIYSSLSLIALIHCLSSGEGRARSSFLAGLFISLLLTIVLFQLFLPYGPLHWLKSVANAGGTSLDEIPRTLNFRAGRWGYSLASPLANLVYVATFLVLTLELFARRKYFSLSIIVVVFCWSIRTMGDYGYVSFIPLALIWMVDSQELSKLHIFSRIDKKIVFKIGLALSGLYLYMFLVYFIIGINNFNNSSTLPAAINFLKTYSDNKPDKIKSLLSSQPIGYSEVIQPSLVALSDAKLDLITLSADSGEKSIAGIPLKGDGSQPIGWFKKYESTSGSKVNYYFHPQRYPYLPKDLPKTISIDDQPFDLTDNSWNTNYSIVEHLPLPGVMPASYGIAIYERRS